MMGNCGCEPELQLRLSTGPSSTDGSSNPMRSSRIMEDRYGNTVHSRRHHQPQQKFTIFYGGQMSVCDVTEIQARAIICEAKQLMEAQIEKSNHYQRHDDGKQKRQSSSPLVPATLLINPELSMKRSLQRFLQKRKMRMDASTPYSYMPHTSSPSLSSS